MKKITCMLFVLLIGVGVVVAEKKRDKRTPFPKVEYRHNHPYVEYQGNWVKLIGIQAKPVGTYIKYAKEMEPTDWKFCFSRYLHYIMDEMKMKRGDKLRVTFEQNGKQLTRDFELKRENRDIATKYYEQCIGQNRVLRNHENQIPEKYKYLNIRMDGYDHKGADWLSRQEAIHDLEHLEWQIENNYSYARLTGFDYPLALDAIRADLNKGISHRDFALQLKMFMANFGDGHSRVSLRYLFNDKSEYRFLPFEIVKDSNVFLAVNPEKKEAWNLKYPQLIAINGIEIEELFHIVEAMVPKTTPKFVEINAIGYLQITAWVLKMAGVEVNDKVSVCFGNGEESVVEELELKNRGPKSCFSREYLKSEILEDNLGYLAIQEHMDDNDEFINSLHKAMKEFKDTKGLIIDIRGNGGGSRAPLKALLPYFIKKPQITNVARYRIDSQKDYHPKNGYLPERYAYPQDYCEYTKAELKCIKQFKKRFKPVKEVSDHKFTENHYMVVSPTKQNGTYYYDKQVVVLVDEGCFSASDIFAAGIRKGDSVLLLGNTTGGGSGFSRSRRLPNSRIKVKLSRIFSYQPDGNMYDGHGVIPDVKLDYTLEDKMGISDSQMDRAMSILLK